MTTATWSYPWLVLSSLLFLGHVSGQSEIRCDITDNRGPKKFAPCAFPFIFRNKRYSQCTQDTDPDGFLWCSTKLDARGRHIAGSGEWGYCDQRCSDSLQTETFISTTTTTTTTSTTTKESLTLPTRSLEAEDTGQNGGRAPSCDSNSPGKGCGGSDVRCDITDQSGPRKSVPCQFPFVFKNVQYNSCTNVSDPAGRLWCSTKVDKDGQHVGGKGDWGYCDQRCVDEPIRQVVTTSTTTPPTPRPAVILPSSEPVVENPMVDGSALPNANDGTCGLSLNVGFVVGGEDAAPGKYPFIAALGYRVSRFATTLEYRCAGSLINRRYVLTAAHCHSSRNRIEEVVLGDHNLATDPDCPTCKPAQRFEITAADVIIPDEFDIKTITSNGYDLALVRLPRLAITANEDPDVAVLPICLAWSPAHRLPNKELVIIGWGRTTDDQSNFGDINEGGAFSNILQQLVLPEFPIEECKKFPLFNNISAEKNFCAGGVKGQDSCKGDSGGPLIARQKEFSPMYLKGIVSFGTIRCARGLPGVYTNLEYFMPWILKNLYP